MLKRSQDVFTKWSQVDDRDSHDLITKLPSQFFSLLDGLTIARSRKHIERYFKESLDQIGHFPTRQKPISVFSGIDTLDRFISFSQLNTEILTFKLSLYSPLTYVKDEYKNLYEKDTTVNFSQGTREKFLIYMMKINFLKRLESSVFAFNLTMERTVEKLGFRKRLRAFQETQLNDTVSVNVIESSNDSDEDDDLLKAEELGKRKYRLEHMKIEEWLGDLADDKTTLGKLADRSNIINSSRDAKLIHLRKLIEQKVKNPTTTIQNTANKKVIVFSAFADTARYLYDQLLDDAESWGVNIALVSGGNGCHSTLGRAEFNEVLTLFSPVSKKRHLNTHLPQDQQIDILIATDCISEGQNLQDCDYLINYDIH